MGLFLFVLALCLQWKNGAYESEFGGHPDEAAHFITGLMVRDYVCQGFPERPMRFAEEYYDHYPKVALGHYPPGFYALEGAWLTVFPVSRNSALAFMALLAAVFGTLAYRGASEELSHVYALAIGILTVALPLTQTMTDTIMADLALAIACLLAARSFSRFLGAPGWRHSLLFGVWATTAAMVKGSGLFLAFLPPLAILIAWKPGVLRRPSLWLAALPVILIVGPWMLYSRDKTAEGMIDRTSLEHLVFAIPYFSKQLIRNFGPSLVVLAFAGIIRLSLRNSSVTARIPFWAVHLSVPVALIAFFSLIPAGLEPRYLLPAIPSVLSLAAMGLTWFSGRLRVLIAAVAAALVLVYPFCFAPPPKQFSGFSAAADILLTGTPGKYLIASDARGEGAFIVEVALRDPARPTQMVKRGSKILATSDWLGRGYETVFDDDEELKAFLNETDLRGIVIDEGVPKIFRQSYHDLLFRVLANGGTPFEEVAAFPALRPGVHSDWKTIRVYRHTSP